MGKPAFVSTGRCSSHYCRLTTFSCIWTRQTDSSLLSRMVHPSPPELQPIAKLVRRQAAVGSRASFSSPSMCSKRQRDRAMPYAVGLYDPKTQVRLPVTVDGRAAGDNVVLQP